MSGPVSVSSTRFTKLAQKVTTQVEKTAKHVDCSGVTGQLDHDDSGHGSRPEEGEKLLPSSLFSAFSSKKVGGPIPISTDSSTVTSAAGTPPTEIMTTFEVCQPEVCQPEICKQDESNKNGSNKDGSENEQNIVTSDETANADHMGNISDASLPASNDTADCADLGDSSAGSPVLATCTYQLTHQLLASPGTEDSTTLLPLRYHLEFPQAGEEAISVKTTQGSKKSMPPAQLLATGGRRGKWTKEEEKVS